MATRGRSLAAIGGGVCNGGGGVDRHSARERGAGASSIRSERGVIDIVVDWMMRGN